MPPPPTADRSVSETDVRRVDDLHFRSRDEHRATSRPATPSVAGSAGAEVESRLGPSLVQLVAEIIEGLEQRSTRDDSSAVWSGVRATPASSKLFHQLTAARARNTAQRRRPVDDPAAVDAAGHKASASYPGDSLTPHNESRDDSANEQLPEKTPPTRGGEHSVDEAAATESESATGRKCSGAAAGASSCSVAVLRQRLLRAVQEDGSSRRGSVDGRPSQRLRAASKDSETTSRKSLTSAVNYGTGMCQTVFHYISV